MLLEWVAENVLLFLDQILVVADNVVVEATLPEMPGTDKAALFVIIEPVESGDRLICSENCASCWWMLHLLVKPENPMNVLRHNDEFIEGDAWKAHR